jgi:hypothetical protein
MSWFYILLFLVWLIGFPYQWIGLRKARARLQDWADRHRLKIVDRRETVLTWKGPFPFRTSSQALYRVVFEDEKGQRHSAYVLCGSPLRGSWVNQVEVRWDERDGLPSRTARRFEPPANRQLLVKSMRALGFRCLLLGPFLGVGIAVVLLQLTGLILSNATVPLLVISAVLGAVVGGLLGVVGGMIRTAMLFRARALNYSGNLTHGRWLDDEA